MATDVQVPALGESITEGTLAQWLKQPGEAVAADEPIASLETDKVTVELPSPVAGVLIEQMAKEGDTVAVGALIARIDQAGLLLAVEWRHARRTIGEHSDDRDANRRAPNLPPKAQRARPGAGLGAGGVTTEMPPICLLCGNPAATAGAVAASGQPCLSRARCPTRARSGRRNGTAVEQRNGISMPETTNRRNHREA